MIMSKSTVSTPSSRYNELAKLRKPARDLWGGTTIMRDEGQTYLPKHPAETVASYKVRLKGTTLNNTFEQTVKSKVGKVFSEDIILNDDVPSQIVYLIENIDGSGRGLSEFMMDSFESAMIDGVSFVLTDYPVVENIENTTAADVIVSGTRPYTIIVTADNLINWSSENIDGVQVLTEIRIKETTIEKDPPWGEKVVNKIRVIRPGEFEVWVQVKNNEYKLESNGVTKLDYIPLTPIYTNRAGFYEGEPPLKPLIELNIAHWVSTSEQNKALSFARFAMLAVTGIEDNTKVIVGADKVIKIQDPQGKAEFIETSGAALEAGREDLNQIEKRMQSAGMHLKVQDGGKVTATAAAIDSDDSNAGLVAVANSLKKSIESILQDIANMMGLPDGGTVQVNTNFGGKVPSGTMTEINQAASLGLMSRELYVNEMIRRGIYDDETDIDSELERLSNAAIIE